MKKDNRIKYARRAVIFFITSLAVMFVICYLVIKSFKPSFGHDISIGYFTTAAFIFSGLLFALFFPSTKYQIKKGNPKSIWWNLLFSDRLESISGFTIGELACLIAIANNTSGTAVFIGSIVGLYMLSDVAFRRIVLEPVD